MTAAPPVRYRVAPALVGTVAAHAARAVPGVVGVSGARADVTGGAADVRVGLVVRLGTSCRDAAVAVQEAVAAAVAGSAGLDAAVRVVVTDVRLG